MEWLETILRFISFWLDKLIYGFVAEVYVVLVDISETSIFTEEIFDAFASKVYGLLGIFMLFKVSFSILTYIVDPDSFLDKSKGFSKLISNIIITLTLLISTPWIFSQAMEIQKIILRDNILGKIFSTTTVNLNRKDDYYGNVMAYQTFNAFYHFDYDSFSDCKADDGRFNSSTECSSQLGLDDSDFNTLRDTLNYAYNSPEIDSYMNADLLLLKGKNNNYVMSYLPIISTLAGVALLLLLIVFCFDVAIRSVKLGFLRMIAPVPIISRIDPKKGKETFDKWVKTSIGTYLDLFIRLLAIYFALFVITQVVDLKFVDATTGLSTDVSVFVKVFIILGALLFAKQVPQLIQDLTGVKMDGKFTINPLKKMSEVPIAGKVANLAIGGTDSMLHGNGFMAGIKRNWKNIPITGGDGKTSVFDTADRKMRKEINEKRDNARQRYEGLKEYSDIRQKWEDGDRIRKRFDNLHESNPEHFPYEGNDFADNFDDGNNVAAYRAAYENEQFISSIRKLDAAKSELKAIKTQYDVEYANGHLSEATQKAYEKQEKIVKGLSDIHEIMRKTYDNDAKTEDAITFRKNNSNDPTNL